jgi:RNA polymerase sigma-70 factor (ECF subfamily)
VLRESELDALMARLVDGDRRAFEPLFRALLPRALRAAERSVGAHLAEDVAQAALLRVFARAAEFEPGRPLLPWFYAIVANEARNVRRRSAAEGKLVESLGAMPVDPVYTAEEAALDEELRRAVQRAVDQLDEPSVEAIHAVFGEGPRPALEPATFRKRLSRAYARLRLLLGDVYGD